MNICTACNHQFTLEQAQIVGRFDPPVAFKIMVNCPACNSTVGMEVDCLLTAGFELLHGLAGALGSVSDLEGIQTSLVALDYIRYNLTEPLDLQFANSLEKCIASKEELIKALQAQKEKAA